MDFQLSVFSVLITGIEDVGRELCRDADKPRPDSRGRVHFRPLHDRDVCDPKHFGQAGISDDPYGKDGKQKSRSMLGTSRYAQG